MNDSTIQKSIAELMSTPFYILCKKLVNVVRKCLKLLEIWLNILLIETARNLVEDITD